MADEPKDMLAREIDEELRRERLLKLWDQYGTYALGVALAVVVGVGGWKFYESQQVAASEAASTRYIVALNALAVKRPEEAQKALEDLAANAPSGYAGLAKLRLAAYEASAGNAGEAVKAYDEVARDSSIDPLLADFARLQAAMLKVDSGLFADVKNRLTPLAAEKNPWRYSARELLGLAAYQSGRSAEARNHFQRLASDKAAPPGIAQRAKVMLAVLVQEERDGKTYSPAEPSAKEPAATEKSEPIFKLPPLK
jgi:hypothetical protein